MSTFFTELGNGFKFYTHQFVGAGFILWGWLAPEDTFDEALVRPQSWSSGPWSHSNCVHLTKETHEAAHKRLVYEWVRCPDHAPSRFRKNLKGKILYAGIF